MPELPEVETIKRQLGEALVGRRIQSIEVLSEKSFEGDPDLLIGAEVVGVRRRGKGLVIDLEKKWEGRSQESEEEGRINEIDSLKEGRDSSISSGKALSLSQESGSSSGVSRSSDELGRLSRKDGKEGKFSLVVHLKMTGQMIYEPHGVGSKDHLPHRIVGGHPTADFISSLPSSHTRVVFHFDDQSVLYFNDQRKFGWVKAVPTAEIEQLSFVAKLGPEPWDMDDESWIQVLQSSKKPVKIRIMDQDRVAGVGNIYANDALWEAQIDPRRPASSLSTEEALLLKEKVIKVLEEGVFYGGATAFDGKFVDLQGLGGKYQEHFRVYQRDGEKCLRNDGGVIQKKMVGGRGTFWCEVCQK